MYEYTYMCMYMYSLNNHIHFCIQKIVRHVPHAEVLALYALPPSSKLFHVSEIMKSARKDAIEKATAERELQLRLASIQVIYS
jgi:hypothetical protein